MRLDAKYFRKFNFTPEQVKMNINNALKDLGIAKEVAILDVKFNYSYSALMKAGIALLSYHGIKVKSVPGHHIKTIEQIGRLLQDDSIINLGEVMRSKRNKGFYGGGVEVTEKECKEYVTFVGKAVARVEKMCAGHSGGRGTGKAGNKGMRA